MTRFISSFALVIVFLLSGAETARADKLRQLVGSSVQLERNLPWSNANDVWIFSTRKPESSIYIFICNNNPTSAHSFTITARQTPDEQTTNYTSDTSRWITDTISGEMSPLAASTCVGGFVATSFSIKFSVQISGAGAESGTPDTFDLWCVLGVADPRGPAEGPGISADTDTAAANNKSADQVGWVNNSRVMGSDGITFDFVRAANGTSDLLGVSWIGLHTVSAGHLFDGSNWMRRRGSIQTGADTSSPLVGISQRESRSYYATNTLTDPSVPDEIIIVTADGAKIAYFDRVVLSSTAVAVVYVNTVSTNGDTCTAENETNLHISSGTAATSVAVSECGTIPTLINEAIRVDIPADDVVILDLKGYIADASSEDGIMINGAISQSAVVTATLYWYEQ